LDSTADEIKVFHPRFVADFVYKHFKLAQLVWRFGRLRNRLERDPAERNYTDVAPTPAPEDSTSLEVLTAHTAPNPMPVIARNQP
jgi:hypothetical protein